MEIQEEILLRKAVCIFGCIWSFRFCLTVRERKKGNDQISNKNTNSGRKWDTTEKNSLHFWLYFGVFDFVSLFGKGKKAMIKSQTKIQTVAENGIPLMVIFRYTSPMPPNPQSTATPPPNPSAPGSPEWWYNEIMRHIEPELLTTVIPTHAETYKDESGEDRVARIEGYDKAFAMYDNVAADFEQTLHKDLETMRKKSRAATRAEEKKEKKKEKRVLKTIEKEISE